MILNVWTFISNLGVERTLFTDEIRIQILLNRTAFLLGIFAFLQSIFNLYLELYTESLIIFTYMLFYIYLLYLSYGKKVLISKILLTVGTNVIILIQSFLLGWEAGFHYFLIPGTIIFLLFFNIKKTKIIFNFLIFSFLFIVIYQYKNNIVYYSIDKSTKELLYISSFLSSIVINYLFYYYIIYNNEEYRINQLLEKREKDELLSALRESVSKTKNILESTPEGFLVLKENIIIDANDSISKILNFSKTDLIGKKITEFLDDVNEEIFLHTIEKISDGLKISNEISFLNKNGEKIPCLMHSTPIANEESNEMFAMVTDISEMKYFQRELVKAMKQAGEATRAKSSFLANMSHEIRTPMNAIIGLSNLALKTELNYKQRDYIEKVNNAGISLLGIINDILDFSKIESGKFEIERNDFNIDKVLDNVFSVTLYKVAEKSLDLNIIIPRELPLGLVGDPLRLGQILINLVNNAVKFTEKGRIDIKLEIMGLTDKNVKIRFRVQDTGIGISKENLSKLFKPFSQTDSSITRKFGGTGLGLSISKNLVELMGGKIWAESEFGIGSSFLFEVEFPISYNIKSDTENINKLRRLNILLIDNKNFYDIITNYLQYLPVAIEQVENIQEALNLINKSSEFGKYYNLLIISSNFSQTEVSELTQYINKIQEPLEKIKIILKTDSKYGEESKYNSYRADGILTKPVNKYLLIKNIYSLFTNQNYHKDNITISSNFNLRGINILLAEDNIINQQVAVELLKTVGAEIDIANNGVELIQKLNQSMGKYDLILMDVMMPEMDGLEATSRILEDERLKQIPILAMTAHALKDEIDECLRVGMKDFIAKPIEPDKLFQTILKWVDRDKILNDIPDGVQSNEVIEKSDFDPENSIPNIKGLNTTSGLRRLGGNISLFNSILIQFYESLLSADSIIKDFQEKGDLDGIRKFAHSTKGSAGNIGHDLIFKIASEIEKDIKIKNLEGMDEKIENFKNSISDFLEEMKEIHKKGISKNP